MEIRIVGCGVMGSAMAERLSLSGVSLSLYDHQLEKAKSVQKRCPDARLCSSPSEGNAPDFLLLAIKPQDFAQAVNHLKGLSEKTTIISILLGVTTEDLQKAFPHHSVVRMMPNLAVQQGEGLLAIADTPDLQNSKPLIEKIFSPLGLLVWMDEKKFDGVTSLTGSGPAFLFAMMEAMVDAAILLGFSSQEGYTFIKQMMRGSLLLAEESSLSLSELRLRICSPGGSTIAGLRAFEKEGVRSGIIETFLAAAKRSSEKS